MKTRHLSKTTTIAVILLSLSFIFMSCDISESQKLDSPEWELVWSDEFNEVEGTSPNPNNWVYDIGRGQSGWGNQELQYYTDRPENVSTDGEGNLVITARSESFNGANFTSARIKTQGKFDQTYGRFEARLKTPYGQGLWPAFWMLGESQDGEVWPQIGEIDIMELRGQLPTVISGSLHGPGYSAGNAIGSSYGLQNARFDTDFYTFAVEWYPNRIDFFVDDFLYNRITKSEIEAAGNEWVFNDPFYLILNVAVGGTYVGNPSAATRFPQTMVIDYVRVYTEAN